MWQRPLRLPPLSSAAASPCRRNSRLDFPGVCADVFLPVFVPCLIAQAATQETSFSEPATMSEAVAAVAEAAGGWSQPVFGDGEPTFRPKTALGESFGVTEM